MGMILRIASSRIVGQGDIVGRSGYFSLNLSANSVMRGRLDARRTLKSLVADLRIQMKTDTGAIHLKIVRGVFYLFVRATAMFFLILILFTIALGVCAMFSLHRIRRMKTWICGHINILMMGWDVA